MLRYESYKYLPPPRPEKAIMPESLDTATYHSWIAQVKKNGTCTIIYVPPNNGKPFAKTRHADNPEHKQWAFTDRSIAPFIRVRTKGWTVFVAELMHSKGNGIRDTHYIHDVLVHDGKYLIGASYEKRHTLLLEIFGVGDKYYQAGPVSHVVVDDNTWIARNHKRGFGKLFARLGNEDEGLVLKDPKSALLTRDNGSWQVKCRRPHKNFGF